MHSKEHYDIVLDIGRMEPCHLGHTTNIKESLKYGDHVLILLGSAFQPRTPKNPFTHQERTKMLRTVVGDNPRVSIRPIRDYLYSDNKWIEGVQATVDELIKELDIKKPKSEIKIAILGHEKDESSYYLRIFPNWKFIDIGPYAEIGGKVIDATRIRQLYFEGHFDFIKGVLDSGVYQFLLEFSKTKEYAQVKEEYDFYKKYKKQWENSPYPVQFNCADAVVVQGGHILLVQRKSSPGKGLWALPGGFINENETSENAAIRELMEETKIKVSENVLRKSIVHKHTKLFDHPNRSLRGRTFSMAYLIELTSGDPALPKVKGSDDALTAKWFTLSEVSGMSEFLFDDHYSIIMHMAQRLG